MSFDAPLVLLLALVAVPLVARALHGAVRRGEAELRDFGEPAILARGSTLGDRRTAVRRAWLQTAALALGLVALARPQLGEREADLARTGRDVLILLDLSRSMTVTDVAPSRLAEAKRAAWETVSASGGDRVGLIVFGGQRIPPAPAHVGSRGAQAVPERGQPRRPGGSRDRHRHRARHRRQGVRARGGARPPRGATGQRRRERRRRPRRGHRQPPRAGIPVFALGVGTTGGGPVPADSSEAPEKYHRDHIGRVAVSRLDEADLRQIARLTSGAYARADRAQDVRALRTALAKVRSRPLSSQKSSERADRFQWPLALGVLALLGDLGFAASAGRRRAATARASTARAIAASLLPLLFLGGFGCARGSLDARKGRASTPQATLPAPPRRSTARSPPTACRFAPTTPATPTTGCGGTRTRRCVTGARPRAPPRSGRRASSISAIPSSARRRRRRSGASCCSTQSRRTRRRCGSIPPIRTPSGIWRSR